MEKFKLLVGALYIAAFVSGSLLTNLIYHHNSKPIKPLGNDAPPIVDDIGYKGSDKCRSNDANDPANNAKRFLQYAVKLLLTAVIGSVVCGIICGILLGMIGSEIG